MPALIEFYEKNADLKDSFEIIGVHNKHELATDFATMDKSIADRGLVEKRWGGKNLPWPQMIDGNGSTVRNWGVFAFPTMAIIDPEGKLHSWGHHHLEAFSGIIDDVRKKRAEGKADKPAAEPEK